MTKAGIWSLSFQSLHRFDEGESRFERLLRFAAQNSRSGIQATRNGGPRPRHGLLERHHVELSYSARSRPGQAGILELGTSQRLSNLSSALVNFVVYLAETHPAATIADVLEWVMLERHHMANERQSVRP